MKEIYLGHIIEGYPFQKFNKQIEKSYTLQWDSLVYNKSKELVREKINTRNTPNLLIVSDYFAEESKKTSINLRDKQNIEIQLENIDSDFRIGKEVKIESNFDQEGRLVSTCRFKNGLPKGSTQFKYDEIGNLIGEYTFSNDNSILTDKKIFEYCSNSNLTRLSEYSDKSSGAGPNYLIEEHNFTYDSENHLISANGNTKYSLKKQTKGLIEFKVRLVNGEKEHLNTYILNEKLDLIRSIYDSGLRYDYERIYNQFGDQIELKCYKNNELYSLTKTIVHRISDS